MMMGIATYTNVVRIVILGKSMMEIAHENVLHLNVILMGMTVITFVIKIVFRVK